MKAVISLELIGDDFYQYQRSNATLGKRKYAQYLQRFGADKGRPWVAKITGFDDRYGLAREFQNGQRDYNQANSVGSRGIFMYYPLDPGLYEIHERLTWKKTRRYFVRIEGVEVTEITREELDQCLNAISA